MKNAITLLACSTLFTATSALAQGGDAAAKAATPEPTALTSEAGYLCTSNRMHNDPKVFWDGFLSGLRGFEHFYEPVGQPIYFESPFNNTQIRALYLHHEFPQGSQLQGGKLDIYAVQARLALTERLGFIATKDGYSEFDAGLLPRDEGWNDIAAGLKYAVIADREKDFVLTPGIRWQWGNGDPEVLQGDCPELSPFISVAKGWGKFHLIGNTTYRLPLNGDDGNDIFQWDVHADYELFEGFAPCFELHGLHYLTDGDRLPLEVGGLDYTNLGSADVAGSSVIWAGLGGRMKFSPHFSTGATFEFGLGDQEEDIMSTRLTVDFVFNW